MELIERMDSYSSEGLSQVVNFPLRSLAMTLIALIFRIYSFLLTLVFVLLWLSDHVIVSVSNAFAPSSKGDVPFHRTVYDYSRAN